MEASVVISIFTVVSQVIGLIRESVIASKLGTSAEYDSILIALALPAMIGAIFLMSLPSAGIPYLQAGNQVKSSLSIFRSRFVISNLIVSLIASLAVYFLVPLAVKLIAPGLDGDQSTTVTFYGRIFCLLIPMRAIQAVFISHLQARFHFVAPALSSIGFNIVIIAILLLLYPVMGSTAYVLAIVLGTLTEMLLVLIPAYFLCRGYRTDAAAHQTKVGHFSLFLGASILIETIWMAVDPFDRYVGGLYLEAGYVSAIFFAGMVSQMPFRVLVLSLGVAIFPSLSEAAHSNDKKRQAMLYHKAMGVSAALLIPITVFCLIFSRQIIEVLFQRGRFDTHSTKITVEALRFYFSGLFFMAAYFIQSRVFYAMRHLRELLAYRAMAFLVKVIIAFVFIQSNWALGLAGGTVAMFASSMVVMEISLIFRHGLTYSRQDIGYLFRCLLAGVMQSAIIVILSKAVMAIIPGHNLIQIAAVVILGIFGAGLTDTVFNISGIDLKRLLFAGKR